MQTRIHFKAANFTRKHSHFDPMIFRFDDFDELTRSNLPTEIVHILRMENKKKVDKNVCLFDEIDEANEFTYIQSIDSIQFKRHMTTDLRNRMIPPTISKLYHSQPKIAYSLSLTLQIKITKDMTWLFHSKYILIVEMIEDDTQAQWSHTYLECVDIEAMKMLIKLDGRSHRANRSFWFELMENDVMLLPLWNQIKGPPLPSPSPYLSSVVVIDAVATTNELVLRSISIWNQKCIIETFIWAHQFRWNGDVRILEHHWRVLKCNGYKNCNPSQVFFGLLENHGN